MKHTNNYYKQREIDCLTKIEEIIMELPPMVYEFIVGKTDYTSPLTRLNYTLDLRIFFDFLTKFKFRGKNKTDITLQDLETLDLTDFETFMAYLSHYTINGKEEICNECAKARKLAAVRAFFKYFFNKGKLSANVPSKLSLPKLHEKEIIRLDFNEISRLVELCENGTSLTERQRAYHKNTKIRDVAIITLFLGTGIRNSELVGLNVSDVNFEDMSFVVTRKGGNRTILYFNDEVKKALFDWVEYRKTIKNLNPNEKALFLSLQNSRITTRAIQQLVKKYAKVVTPLKKITPHKLRSTFGTNLYHETNDIYLVADFLGHSDVNTTKKHYAAMSEDLRRKAIKSVKIKDDDND